MSYQQWEERRKYKRYPSDLSARYAELRKAGGEERQGAIMNVSRGGIFIQTSTPAPTGTELDLRITVVTPFGDEQEIRAQAQVVWVIEGPEERGMGLSFSKIDRHSQYALLACAYRGET